MNLCSIGHQQVKFYSVFVCSDPFLFWWFADIYWTDNICYIKRLKLQMAWGKKCFETPEGSAVCYYIKNNKQCQELQFWAFKWPYFTILHSYFQLSSYFLLISVHCFFRFYRFTSYVLYVSVDGYLSLYVSPVINWWLVQCVLHFHPKMPR